MKDYTNSPPLNVKEIDEVIGSIRKIPTSTVEQEEHKERKEEPLCQAKEKGSMEKRRTVCQGSKDIRKVISKHGLSYIPTP